MGQYTMIKIYAIFIADLFADVRDCIVGDYQTGLSLRLLLILVSHRNETTDGFFDGS
jgi:hypothetical protein